MLAPVQPKGDRAKATVGIVAALVVLGALAAEARAQNKPRDPRAVAAMRLLEMEGDEAMSLATYVVAMTGDEAGLVALLARPLHDTEYEFDRVFMLQRSPILPEAALPFLMKVLEKDYGDDRVCDGFRAYCEVATAKEVALVEKLRRPAGNDPTRLLACIGAWSLADFEALAPRIMLNQPHYDRPCVAVPVREAAAGRALSWLTAPGATLKSKREGLAWLAELKIATPQIVAAISSAIDDAALRSEAQIALDVVLRAAPISITLPETRLAALWRSSNSSALAVPLALRSTALATELSKKLVRDGICAAEHAVAALRPLPKPIEQWLIDEVRSADAQKRDCALKIASAAVADHPALLDVIVPVIPFLTPDSHYDYAAGNALVDLIEAGAGAKIVNVIIEHLLSPPDITVVSSSLFRYPLPATEAARVRRALITPDPRYPAKDTSALIALGPVPRAEALELIERSYDQEIRGEGQLGAWMFIATGGDEAPYLAARLRSNAIPQLPAPLAPMRRQVELALALFGAQPGPHTSAAALRLLKHHIDNGEWNPADLPFLRSLLDAPALAAPVAGPLRLAISAKLAALSPKPPPLWRYVKVVFGFFGAHFIIWIALLFTVYPRSRAWQSLMLFNREARVVTGLWYTQVLVRFFPVLRRRMFQPLLEGDAARAVPLLDAGFFSEISLCPLLPGKTPQAPRTLDEAVPWQSLLAANGVVVIEGESGAGKSQMLRALSAAAREQGRTCLLIRASDCAGGVIKAMENALELGHADGFVSTLLYGGAIELFLDGLNEALPSTVKEIDAFCHRARHARVFITSQPMRWAYPAGARTWRLMPLAAEQIRDFLHAQWKVVVREGLDEETYMARVKDFFDARPFEERDVREQEVLRNRFDLAFVAYLLSRGQEPNLHALRKQVVDEVERDYAEAVPGGVFPMSDIGALAVHVLESGDPLLSSEGIDAVAIELLVERKLLLRRGDGTITFRHDSITCYFAAEGVFAKQATAESIGASVLDAAHVASARFRGVYLQLAESLPLPAAERLALALRDYQRANNGPTELDREFQAIVDRRQRAAT